MIKAIFIDRDGTLIDEPITEVVDTWDKFKIKNDVSCLVDLKKADFRLFMISNQEGINDGRLDEDFYDQTNGKLLENLQRHSITIEGVYTCPHAISENCACRKPKAGLLTQVLKNYKISFEQSWVIGDRASDIELAQACGMKSIFIKSNIHKPDGHKPDFVTDDLRGAVEYILRSYEATTS